MMCEEDKKNNIDLSRDTVITLKIWSWSLTGQVLGIYIIQREPTTI
jgi:hypothetical protein